MDFSPKEQIEEAEARLYALAEHGAHVTEVMAPAMYAAAVSKNELAHKGDGPGCQWGIGLSTRR